ncbi:hypothetical protein [Pelomonas sp. KK5]|uniref:hypothetical protein n=1 Tax=Pelomonas sp. KK5 TaxID=1855730 RepID=UPI00117DD45C|nr:hypothetical protein [Pelomonas sp. KK5]
MSRRWPETISVLVMPTRVAVIGGSPVQEQQPCADGPASLPAALTALLAGIAAPRKAWRPRPRVRLLLSHQLAALTLVAHARELQNDEERQAAARHGFAAVHGPAVADWEIVVDRRQGGDAALAVGLDTARVEGLRQAVAQAGCALQSIEPLISAAAGAAAALRLPAAWLVIAEPGRVVLARHQDGAWRSLRTHRPRRTLAEDLGAWIDQARLIDGIEGTDQIVLASTERHDLDGLARPGWNWVQQAIMEAA